jgi:hypothetical protein
VSDLTATAAVEAVMQAAVAHLSVPREQISVEQVTAVDFPDASLGCPHPDRVVAQVITPGYAVVVRAAGRRLEYRVSARDGSVVPCSME